MSIVYDSGKVRADHGKGWTDTLTQDEAAVRRTVPVWIGTPAVTLDGGDNFADLFAAADLPRALEILAEYEAEGVTPAGARRMLGQVPARRNAGVSS